MVRLDECCYFFKCLVSKKGCSHPCLSLRRRGSRKLRFWHIFVLIVPSPFHPNINTLSKFLVILIDSVALMTCCSFHYLFHPLIEHQTFAMNNCQHSWAHAPDIINIQALCFSTRDIMH